MKTSTLVSLVAGAHVVLIVSILFVQGCGTTAPVSSMPPPEPKMPGDVVPEPKPMPAHVASKPVAHPSLPVVAPPVKSWPSETTTYKVQKGDSLSLIAARFDVSRAEVMALNHLKDANRVVVGQQLKLPGKVNLSAPVPVKKAKPAAKPAVAAGKSAPASSKSTGTGDYTVQPGDSLSKIASKNGTTTAALRAANNLKSDKLQVGHKLIVAGTAPAKKTGNAGETAAVVAPPPAAPAAAVSEPVAAPAIGVAPAAPAAPADSTVPPAPPAVSSPAVQGAPPAPPAATVTRSFRSHTVEQGEDLYHVSLMWDVSVDELQRVNNLTGTTLTAGQVLQIPLPE